MDEDEKDTYVAQLKEVFISCDTSGSGCLDERELMSLCLKLHLTDQTDYFVFDLLQKNNKVEVEFEDFKNSFVSLLSQATSNDEEEEETQNELTVEEITEREVSPKFTLGEKQYGRRSRPASTIEEDGILTVVQHEEHIVNQSSSPPTSLPYKVNIKLDVGPGKRCVSPSYFHQPPAKSGRISTDILHIERGEDIQVDVQHNHQISNSDIEGNSYSENPVEYLQQTWKRLEIGSDGFLTVEELALVCEHIGMDMSDEVISQLFEKLDCDQDGRISFNEFVQGLFQHGEPQNCDSALIQDETNSLFKDSARDEQLSTVSISGIFSCIDENNTGYADGNSIMELWESLQIPVSAQTLEDLGLNQRQKINLSDLSTLLEEEILSAVTAPVGQLAWLSYQNELNYLRQSHEQMRIERNKLRETVEDANCRAAMLAQEIDDNHAKLESTLQHKLILAEKKYHEQVRELVEDQQQERESLTLQTNKLKQQLLSEIQSIREEESHLKNRLAELEQENTRLESELQEVSERCRETEKQKELLIKELAGVPLLKEKLADLESHQGEIRDYQYQSLLLDLEHYKRINQELQDKIDELTLEMESVHPPTIAIDAISNSSSVNRTHSWLSDYKNAALIGFKRRGSDSSSEENSDDECPTLKMRRTFLPSDDQQSSLEPEIRDEKGDSDTQRKKTFTTKGLQPSSLDVLLRDMFVDQERLKAKLYTAEDKVQKAEFSNFHLRNKCKILTRLAYDVSKTAVA